MKNTLKSMQRSFLHFPYWRVKTKYNLLVNSRKTDRRLEIGPGAKSIPGFETLNIIGGSNVDYVADASINLPFDSESFELIYASHILEHIPWYLSGTALQEWARVLKPGGKLELWVPDGLKICQAFVEAENGKSAAFMEDGWFYENPDKDACLWASGRIFTYGDGSRNICHPNWHRAILTERLLKRLLKDAGFENVRTLPSSAVRGADHGWINLGICATKPVRNGLANN